MIRRSDGGSKMLTEADSNTRNHKFMYELTPAMFRSLSVQHRIILQKQFLESRFAAATKLKCPEYLLEESESDQGHPLVLFFNCIGGLGDSIPILLAMELYKKICPPQLDSSL